MTSEQLEDFRTDIDQLIKANEREQGKIRAYLGIDEAKLILAHIDEQQRKIEKMTEALQIISNERQCLNNLMSNREVAAEALKGVVNVYN